MAILDKLETIGGTALTIGVVGLILYGAYQVKTKGFWGSLGSIFGTSEATNTGITTGTADTKTSTTSVNPLSSFLTGAVGGITTPVAATTPTVATRAYTTDKSLTGSTSIKQYFPDMSWAMSTSTTSTPIKTLTASTGTSVTSSKGITYTDMVNITPTIKASAAAVASGKVSLVKATGSEVMTKTISPNTSSSSIKTVFVSTSKGGYYANV